MSLAPKFIKDSCGHVGVIFAISVVPLIALSSLAVDYSQFSKEDDAISSALDAAVLAAANNNAIENAEKHSYAETHFRENYRGNIKLKLDSSVTSDQVRLQADGMLDLTLAKVVGFHDILISETSAASLATQNTICVLALSEDEDAAISFDSDTEFLASDCAVQSNSNSSKSIVAEKNLNPPSASSFCAVGGVSGQVEPHSKGECRPVINPYKDVAPAPLGQCKTEFFMVSQNINTSGGGAEGGSNGARENRPGLPDLELSPGGDLPAVVAGVIELINGRLYSRNNLDNELVPVSENLTGGNIQLTPGTYCGGLTVDGLRVTFAPGDYIFKDGPLTFLNESEAKADRVTFSFQGTGALLNVESGSSFDIRAATTGPRRGLAFMQMVNKEAAGNSAPNAGVNRIANGGKISMSGTAYFPEQTLLISGEDTQVGASSPAVGLIANTIKFQGKRGSKVEIGVDYVKAGVPPILPQVDDGVRLIE